MAPNYRIASGGGIFCTKRCALLNRQSSGEMLPTLGCRETHPNWKGGKINHNGYVKVIVDNGGDFPYRREHIVLAERILGRPLLKDEVIHHIDENTKNNALGNLSLMKTAEHSILHGRIRKLKKSFSGQELILKIAAIQPTALVP